MSTKITTYSGSSLGSPPPVKRREAASNLKRRENKRVSKITCLVKEKDKCKPTNVERLRSLKLAYKYKVNIYTLYKSSHLKKTSMWINHFTG